MNEQVRNKKRAATISLLVGFIMFFMKISAYVLTGSTAILSDALESIVHIIATSLAFFSLFISLRPPDDSHPYGHGKIEYFSAGFEGGLIVIAAIIIIYFAIEDFIFGIELKQLDIGAFTIFIASLINLFLALFLINTGKKTNSLILVADGKHILTDSVTSFAVILSIGLVLLTGWKYFDPLIAIIVALNIIQTGIKLISQSVGGLMHARDEKVLQKVIDSLNEIRSEDMIEIHKLRSWDAGNIHYVDFHLIIPNYRTIEDSHQIQKLITEYLRKNFGTNLQTMLHFDPCQPYHCKHCSKNNCNIRKETFQNKLEWNIEEAIKGSMVDI